jgi:hypothetical protein
MSEKMRVKLDNFFFFRPEGSSYTTSGDFELSLGLYFYEDETYFKWIKLQKYLFDNYDINEYNKGKFSFIAYGSPIYGVVDGVLLLIPFEDDDRIKPELKDYFKDIHSRMNNTSCDKPIMGYTISELYDIFELDKVSDDYNPQKQLKRISDNVYSYRSAYTFHENINQ